MLASVFLQCISIPVEIIRDSTPSGAGSQPRHESPFRTLHNESPYGGFADSPTWNTSMNAQPSSRFLPRQSPNPSYDRVIHNSQFNQPLNDRVSYQQYQEPQFRQPQQRMYQPGSANFSRSSEDLLNTPFDPMGYGPQPTFASLIPPSFGTGFRPESDFVHGNKFTSPLRRSYDALNDFADMHQSFPSAGPYVSEQQQQPQYRTSYQTQHQPQPQQQQQQQPTYGNQAYMNPNIVYTNQYGVPVDHHRPHAFQETGPGCKYNSQSSRLPSLSLSLSLNRTSCLLRFDHGGQSPKVVSSPQEKEFLRPPILTRAFGLTEYTRFRVLLVRQP